MATKRTTPRYDTLSDNDLHRLATAQPPDAKALDELRTRIERKRETSAS